MANVKERKKSVALSFSLQKKGKYVLLAKDSMNCDCQGGRLKTGLGGNRLFKNDNSTQTCPVDNVVLLVARKDLDNATKTYSERFCAIDAQGNLYVQDEVDGGFTLVGGGFSHAHITQFAGEDNQFKLAVITDTRCIYFKQDGNFDTVLLDHACEAGCFYEHRMFLGEKPATLLCSAPEDVLDFTESIHDGGLIRFPNVGGELVAIKGFHKRLYLFFEHGIMRINASGAVKNFTADALTYSGGKIYGKTVCVGTYGLYFLAADGVYRLDGEKCRRLLSDFVLPPTEESGLESSVAYSGRIVIRYLTGYGYRTLVFYEDEESGYYLDGMPIFTGEDGGRCLFTDENNVICQLAEDGENGLDGTFSSMDTLLGRAGRKRLVGLHFEGKGSFELTVKTKTRTLTRRVVFQDGQADVRLSERSETFSFAFALDYGTEIASMAATYTYLTGGEGV